LVERATLVIFILSFVLNIWLTIRSRKNKQGLAQ
jgi:hypothetical protein